MLTNLYTKTSASSRAALTVTIAFIAVMGSYNWLIEPHVKYLEAAQRYAGEVDTIGKKNKLIESKLKIKQLEVDKLSSQIAAAQDKFLTAAAAQQFFVDIELFAIQTHCTITSLNQLSDQTSSAKESACDAACITPRRSSIRLIGSYANIIKFLTRLLDRPNKIIISPFTLSVRQNDSEILECSFTLTIFVTNEVHSKGTDPNE